MKKLLIFILLIGVTANAQRDFSLAFQERAYLIKYVEYMIELPKEKQNLNWFLARIGQRIYRKKRPNPYEWGSISYLEFERYEDEVSNFGIKIHDTNQAKFIHEYYSERCYYYDKPQCK